MQLSPSTIAITEGKYWQWRGYSIYYVRAGAKQHNRPPLLLVHGFGASTDHWRKNIDRLQEEFSVWAIDLLGFGRSTKADTIYGGDLWRDQLHDFITEVIGEPAILAGNSLGGYASLCLAAQCPESAKGLILLNSAGPFSDSPNPKKPNLLQKTIGSLLRQPWASYLLFQYLRQPSVIKKTLNKVYLDRSAVTDRLVAEIRRPAYDKGADKVFASVFKSPQGEKVDILLQQLQHPLLLLWGEGDPWMNARDRSQKFRKYYPNLTEYYFQAGHCPHDEVPDRINEKIALWVKELSQG
jgi:pimeloyl-ACP methyl ester carboxylesterase